MNPRHRALRLCRGGRDRERRFVAGDLAATAARGRPPSWCLDLAVEHDGRGRRRAGLEGERLPPCCARSTPPRGWPRTCGAAARHTAMRGRYAGPRLRAPRCRRGVVGAHRQRAVARRLLPHGVRRQRRRPDQSPTGSFELQHLAADPRGLARGRPDGRGRPGLEPRPPRFGSGGFGLEVSPESARKSAERDRTQRQRLRAPPARAGSAVDGGSAVRPRRRRRRPGRTPATSVRPGPVPTPGRRPGSRCRGPGWRRAPRLARRSRRRGRTPAGRSAWSRGTSRGPGSRGAGRRRGRPARPATMFTAQHGRTQPGAGRPLMARLPRLAARDRDADQRQRASDVSHARAGSRPGTASPSRS